MLEFLRARGQTTGPANERKLRLYACGCVRQVWPWLTDEKSRRAIEFAEEYTDKYAAKSKLEQITLQTKLREIWEAAGARWTLVLAPLSWAIEYSAWTATTVTEPRQRDKHPALQAALLRDIFFLPFRSAPAFDRAWLMANDGLAGRLARTIYGARAFDRMPVLADALEEAGCADADVLSHCRGAGPHARGCWVVDLVSGKS
jgi:hypothetical protein